MIAALPYFVKRVNTKKQPKHTKCFSCFFGPIRLYPQITIRTDWFAIDPYFKMQMRSGALTSGTDLADLLTSCYLIAIVRDKGGHMTIERTCSAAMIDDDIVAVGAVVASGDDLAICRSDNFTAAGGADIDTGMHRFGLFDRMDAGAIGRSDAMAAGAGPNHRGWCLAAGRLQASDLGSDLIGRFLKSC